MSSFKSLSIPKFSAVAFDFDGTLVDTLELHYEAYREAFLDVGVQLSRDDFFPNLGGKASEAIPLFLRGRSIGIGIEELHQRKKEIVSRLFANAPLKIYPTVQFLEMFKGKIPIALVSSGSRAGIMQLLERLSWTEYFDIIITGEDTKNSKPDAAPYLLATELIGIPASQIAVFEDTQAGIEAATSAGMPVFDVSNNLSFSI